MLEEQARESNLRGQRLEESIEARLEEQQARAAALHERGTTSLHPTRGSLQHRRRSVVFHYTGRPIRILPGATRPSRSGPRLRHHSMGKVQDAPSATGTLREWR